MKRQCIPKKNLREWGNSLSEETEGANGLMQSSVENYRYDSNRFRMMPPDLSPDLADRGTLLAARDLRICRLECAMTEAPDCP
jgi:hypothetical protein